MDGGVRRMKKRADDWDRVPSGGVAHLIIQLLIGRIYLLSVDPLINDIRILEMPNKMCGKWNFLRKVVRQQQRQQREEIALCLRLLKFAN